MLYAFLISPIRVTRRPTLTGSQGHVILNAQNRSKLGGLRSCRSFYQRFFAPEDGRNIICSLFNDAFSETQKISHRKKGWQVNDELENKWKEAVVA
jgi:hypothetical protein